jgi:hypothetical protein
MLTRHDENPEIELLPGVRRRILSVGEKLMVVEFRNEGGLHSEGHSHPHESTGYLLEGEAIVEVEEARFMFFPAILEHSGQCSSLYGNGEVYAVY